MRPLGIHRIVRGRGFRKPLRNGSGDGDVKAGAPKHPGEDMGGVRMILHQEQAHRGGRRDALLRRFLRRIWRRLHRLGIQAKREADAKCGALAFPSAFGGDRAAMGIDDRLADRQAEAQAAELLRDLAIALLKGAEDPRQDFRSDANARCPETRRAAEGRRPPFPGGSGRRSGRPPE